MVAVLCLIRSWRASPVKDCKQEGGGARGGMHFEGGWSRDAIWGDKVAKTWSQNSGGCDGGCPALDKVLQGVAGEGLRAENRWGQDDGLNMLCHADTDQQHTESPKALGDRGCRLFCSIRLLLSCPLQFCSAPCTRLPAGTSAPPPSHVGLTSSSSAICIWNTPAADHVCPPPPHQHPLPAPLRTAQPPSPDSGHLAGHQCVICSATAGGAAAAAWRPYSSVTPLPTNHRQPHLLQLCDLCLEQTPL